MPSANKFGQDENVEIEFSAWVKKNACVFSNFGASLCVYEHSCNIFKRTGIGVFASVYSCYKSVWLILTRLESFVCGYVNYKILRRCDLQQSYNLLLLLLDTSIYFRLSSPFMMLTIIVLHKFHLLPFENCHDFFRNEVD